MDTHQEATNIFREDLACGDTQAALELLFEEGLKLVDRKVADIRESTDTVITNEKVAVRHARTDEEVSNIIADYSALLTFEISVTHSIGPELMLLIQEYVDAQVDVWFPAGEQEDDNSNNSDDDDDDSDNDNHESDAGTVNRADTPLTSGNPCLSDYTKESLMKQESLDRVAAVESWQRNCDAHERSQSLEEAKGKRKAEDQLQAGMAKRRSDAAVYRSS